ncbi:GTP 3',8-cyclase MoaA [Methylophaga pinxianii]|uniref:GTP 3',8-cyclase MoaA n=1 Tax=Methylophaga pinxianii TaxID=2881052 RepID=UPI001CF54E9E|nr:GTP 3',8-cyclase MoaA [Methylophaga pinxianii]MCB2425529.1 GTP 3',8-cyclase MoaA [Methylophaga pinxianii]UPH47223.1 GTP 3',8-cyclase MoaA [Methylophaga pinxianii]
MTTQLIDSFNRRIDYVRISVTDRCDLRCNYCMPKGFTDYEEPKDWLTFDEIERVVKAFTALGVENIRLTGGEPLLRKDLPVLVSRLSQVDGIDDISLSTNATQLEKHAVALKTAGLNRLNVSMDSVDPKRFHELCGRDALDDVLKGLKAAKEANLNPIKINSVYLHDTPDHEVDALVEFCIENHFVLRLIEAMPMGDTGRAAGKSNLQKTKLRLQSQYGLTETIERGPGPAKYLVSGDGQFKIGFITPMSQHFCESCNRVRLSVDGTLYLCLGQNDRFELRPLLRSGASQTELIEAIQDAIKMKPERHEFNESPKKIIRIMARTGG